MTPYEKLFGEEQDEIERKLFDAAWDASNKLDGIKNKKSPEYAAAKDAMGEANLALEKYRIQKASK